MRRNLLLIVALAVFGAALVPAMVGAQTGDVLGVGEDDVSVDLPGGEDLPDVGGGTLPACSNLGDDDGDGAVDMGDPGCSGPTDGDEYNAPTGTTGTTDDPEVPVEPEPTGTTDDGYDPSDSDLGTSPDGGGTGGEDIRSPGGGGGGGTAAPGGGDRDGPAGKGERDPIEPPPIRTSDGKPTSSNPTVTISGPAGPTPIGVPNPVIDSFEIPPFLLPIFQACGVQYGIEWEVLASINRAETYFGTNLSVSTAGAVGWMQFLPSTWRAYGVDANEDGVKDPYNPVDAICAAARYLAAAGGQEDLRAAIFAYNHADWYVDEIITVAEEYGDLPPDLVSSVTGLTEGAHFPVAARARYADDISEREVLRRAKPTHEGSSGNLADVISAPPTEAGVNIYAREGSPVVAVNDGEIIEIGKSDKLGRFIVLRDDHGNRFTYAQLGRIEKVYPVPEPRDLKAKDFKLITPPKDEPPTQPATDKDAPAKPAPDADSGGKDGGGGEERGGKDGGGEEQVEATGPVNTEDLRERLFALPERRNNLSQAGLTGQLDALFAKTLGGGYETVKAYLGGVLRFDRRTMDLRQLREGSRVVGGTVLARIGEADGLAPHINFSIRPTGRGAPKINPKIILDGWQLLDKTRIYDAAGRNPFAADSGASISEILLMSKTQLERAVLTDPRLEIYSCGREDVRTQQISLEILRVLKYLTARGFRLAVTSLKCGHSVYTSTGNVSAHSTGHAVDIASVNGIPIMGHQGRGSITEAVINELLELQGPMVPDQIISLMNMGGPTFAMSDHADHIHVGYPPASTTTGETPRFVKLLGPDQWGRLIDRLEEIGNPDVRAQASEYALPAGNRKGGKPGRASDAHVGE